MVPTVSAIKNILVIDDDVKILNVIKNQLKNEQYHLEMINDPIRALQSIFQNEFDLIILDIKMEPINGFEILKRVKENRPGLPIIILSAYNDDQTKSSADKLGSNNYLVKPVRKKDLISAINNITMKY
jgi:CheY-like chemotaxis protein